MTILRRIWHWLTADPPPDQAYKEWTEREANGPSTYIRYWRP